LRSLLERGVPLSFGSDAPVATHDPWQGIEAAVERRRGADRPWYPAECLSPEAALSAYQSAPTLGWTPSPSDFLLVRDGVVEETWIAGRRVWPTPSG